MRTPTMGNFPLKFFARALEEYKSTQSFQSIILYTKRMLEECFMLLDPEEGQYYTETMGMEDFIGQSFRLKAAVE